MRFFFLIALFFLLAAVAVSAFTSPAHSLSPFKAFGHVQDWTPVGPANADEWFSVHFFLKQRNLETLSAHVDAVSNPESKLYGHYWSQERLAAEFANPIAMASVSSWLSSTGARNIRVIPTGDLIRAEMTIASIEQHFSATMMKYAAGDRKISRCAAYSIPAAIAPHVEFVSHLNHFPSLTKFSGMIQTAKPASALDANNGVTPALLNQFYSIQSNTVQNQRASQALFEDDAQSFNYADLASFQQQFNLPSANVTAVYGANSASSCVSNPNNCVESMLDTEWIMAVAQGSPTSFYLIDSSDSQPFVDFLSTLLDLNTPPLVSSMSYGETESQVPSSITTQFNTVIQKTALRGMTICVSSGDDGAAGSGARGNVPAGCGFNPSYPASSPYVVAVGATQGPEMATPISEIGCASETGGLITSGGGFSGVFPQMPYQAAVVNTYLKNTNSSMPPASAGYNVNGRGYPDVSLLGHNYYDVVGGQTYMVSGTSASSPVFAGMLTLINSARLNAGKAPVGYVNPALYQIYARTPGVFNDITNGINNCPVLSQQPTGAACCQYGFPAVRGWDAMTGLGSVNFNKLLAAFLALP